MMTSRRSLVLSWIEDGTIAPDRIPQALKVSGIIPDAARWRRFLDQLLLALGALSLAFAVVFFIAYNWDDLGLYAQFGMVQLLMLVAVVAYWRLGPGRLSGKLSLLIAAILLGALLALYGQTYQTGADPWQLFASWAVLMLPWALVGGFAPLWLLWLGLLNLALALYYQTFFGLLWLTIGSAQALFWLLFVLNSVAWLLWEVATPRFEWLAGRWGVRLIATASGCAITMLVLRAIFDSDAPALPAWVVFTGWLATLYFIYRTKIPDLFVLAGACLSLIVCITSLAADLTLQTSQSAAAFLLLTILVVALAAGAAVWLRRVHEEQSA